MEPADSREFGGSIWLAADGVIIFPLFDRSNVEVVRCWVGCGAVGATGDVPTAGALLIGGRVFERVLFVKSSIEDDVSLVADDAKVFKRSLESLPDMG